LVAAEIGVIADTSTAAIARASRLLSEDLPELSRELPEVSGPLVSINPVGSDRHAGGAQVVSFDFGGGGRVYYKPVPLEPTALFHEFIELIDLPLELRPRPLGILDRGTYGWLEEAIFSPCENISEVRRYWSRCGAVLAVCCLLNFTDGHFNNLVSMGEHPVLIDTETLFQNYSWRNYSGRLESVVDTGLVQRAKAESPGRGSFSAFQVVGSGRLCTLTPRAINDGTDIMETKFRRITHEPPINMPVMDGRFQTVDGYVKELITGFRTVFDLCRKRKREILADGSFWDRVAAQEARQIIRETAYYVRLLRLIEQPDYAASRDSAATEIASRLRLEEGSRYNRLVPDEVSALLSYDVPYFKHRVSAIGLTTHSGNHDSFFRTSALTQIRDNISDWGDAFIDAQHKFLEDNLSISPADASLSPVDEQLLGDVGRKARLAKTGLA
jgi:lantibiotic modifying enzyme